MHGRFGGKCVCGLINISIEWGIRTPDFCSQLHKGMLASRTEDWVPGLLGLFLAPVISCIAS